MNQIVVPVSAGPAASPPSFSPAPSVVHNHLPLPGTPLPNTPSTGYAQSTISMASSISSPAMWPPSSPAPYFPPPPAAPAELYDPLSPVWQTSAPPTQPNASYSPYAGMPHSQTMQQVPHYAHHPAEPTRSPAPAAFWDGHAQPPHHHQFTRQTEYRPEGGVAYAAAPVPYLTSATPVPGATAFGIPQYSPPLPCPSPVPQRRSPGPPQAPATPAPRSRTPLRTPPPPSPSAAYRPSPSTSPAPDEALIASQICVVDAPGLLETIGEDGESQAGTAKSAMLPTGMTDALRAPGPGNAPEKADAPSANNSPGRNSVQDLEELVEAAEQALEQTRAQSPTRTRKAETAASELADKALPAVPSQHPSARSIFAHDSSASSEQSTSSPAPASPVRTASSSPPKREPGGLAALQARLARSTPPTANAAPKMSPRPEASRSPSPTKSLLNPTALGHVSALRARSISRASRYQQAVREAEEEDPREVVRRVRARSGLAPINIADLANLAALETKAATLSLSTPEPSSSTSDASDPEKRSPCLADGLTSPPLSPRRPLPSPPQAPSTTTSMSDAPMMSFISPTPTESAPVTSSSPAQSPRRPVFRSRSPPTTEAVSSIGPSEEETDPESRKTGQVSSSSSKAEERASPPKKAPSPSPWSRNASPWSPRLPHRATTTTDPTPPPTMGQPRSDSTPAVDRAGRKVVNFEEMKELKQDAVHRVAGWLDVGGGGTPDLSRHHDQLEPSSPRSPATRYVPSNLSGPNARAPSLKAVPSTEFSDRTRSSSRSSARDVSEPTVAQVIAAETRAAMRKSQQDRTGSLSSVTSVQKGLNSYLAALEQDASFERDAQAHKSPKVAKPGKVRSVASIWAERVEEAEVRLNMPGSSCSARC